MQVVGSAFGPWFRAICSSTAQVAPRRVLRDPSGERQCAKIIAMLTLALDIDGVLLGAQKHEPAFYDSVSRRLQEKDGSSSPVLFIDDLETNVQQARLAGWQAVHATPDQRWITDVKRLLRLPSH